MSNVKHANFILHLHCVPKNFTNLSCYKFDIAESMLTIFSTNVTEKVGNQKLLHFPTSPK